MQALFDPARHEALSAQAWQPARALGAIERICASADDEFSPADGHWPWHPQDDPPQPGARSFNLYWGATGVVWALRHLASAGAVSCRHDHSPWVARYPDLLREEAADEAHGTASYLFGESAALLLAWRQTRQPEFAQRLHAAVRGNLHNPAHEPLWGNAGTLLAAIHMAEAGAGDDWGPLVSQGLQALFDDMRLDPTLGTWLWQQDLYGRQARYLGAGHGLAGNAYAVWRGARHGEAGLVRNVEQRVLATLTAAALPARHTGPDGEVDLLNWHVLVDPERVAAWLAKGGRPLVQDCHGAPGIVSRLAGMPREAAWDTLLRGAGELTWRAGPLAKGPSLCHGTAGSAMACLKLWRRFDEPLWLERARRLALHAADQVEAARRQHGQGRHSLWTGDLGVACVLWNCLQADDRFPTLDHF